MVFADPAFSRSLRENPLLQDYFENLDREDHSQNDKRSSLVVQNEPNQRDEPNFFSSSHSPGSSSYVRSNKPQRGLSINNPFIECEGNRNRILELVQDPMGPISGFMDPNRLARIEMIAEGLQRDDRAHQARREERIYQNEIENNALRDRLVEYASDPQGDFGSLDLNRLKRVEVLANIVPEENHLIVVNEDQNLHSPRNVFDSNKELFERCEAVNDEFDRPNIKERLRQNLEEINTVQKVFDKAKKIIVDITHPFDRTRVPVQNVNKFTAAIEISQNQKLMHFENFMRGICDGGVYLTNLAQKGISKCVNNNYSSEEFLNRNLIGKTDEQLSSLSYWTGRVVFELSKAEIILGKPLGFSKAALSATLQVTKKAALEAAVVTKLTTGAISSGLNKYIPKLLGGSISELHHSVNPYNIATQAVIEKTIEEVAINLKQIPNLVNKSPKLALALEEMSQGTLPFFRQVISSVSAQITPYIYQNSPLLEPSLVETESIANKAVEEIFLSGSNAQDIFQDFEKIVEHLADPTACFESYQELVYRTQMRSFFYDLDFSTEATSYIMQKIPSNITFEAKSLEETIKMATLVEKTIRYCDKYVQSNKVKKILIEILKPFQVHHALTDKCIKAEWTRDFQRIIIKYDLDLNGKWNKMRMPHQGRHPDEYHEWIMDKLQELDNYIEDNASLIGNEKQELFLKLFEEEIKIPLQQNPLLCTGKWYKFWKNDKLQADSTKSFSIKEETINTP